MRAWLGTCSYWATRPWKIRRVEQGRVRVEDAQGQAPTIPFWLGEAPGRTWELSDEVSAIRDGIDRRLDRPGEARSWLMEVAGVSEEAAGQMVAYIEEGKRVLGMVPTGSRIVAERFLTKRRDATGHSRPRRLTH